MIKQKSQAILAAIKISANSEYAKSIEDGPEYKDFDPIALQQLMHEEGIWAAVKTNDLPKLKTILKENHKLLEQRDSAGASPLLIAFLYRNFEIGKYIVEHYSNYACQTYTEQKENIYGGENILHLAIVHRDFEVAKWLIDREPRLLEVEPTGSFFQPGEPCYFGGKPFLFAVSTNEFDLVTYILTSEVERTGRRGFEQSSLNLRDRYGNNALHMCVVHDRLEMYDYIFDLAKFRIHQDGLTDERHMDYVQSVNNEKLTPLALAAAMGKEDMFKHILDKLTHTAWTYGPVKSRFVPLLDFECPRYGTDAQGNDYRQPVMLALEALCISNDAITKCNNTDDCNLEEVQRRKLDMMDMVVVKRILDKKWKYFGAKRFFRKFIVVLVMLICFSIATVCSAKFRDSKDFASYASISGVLFIISATCLYIGTLGKIMLEIREIRESGRGYFKREGAELLDNVLSWAFSFCAVAAGIARFAGYYNAEAGFSSIAALTAWFYVFFFLLGYKSTGPFVIMIQNMVYTDIRRFLLVYFSFLCGYGQAIYLLMDVDDNPGNIYYRLQGLVLNGFSVKGVEMDEFAAGSSISWLSQGLIFFYMVSVVIMLINLLIAMMGNTYTNVYEASQKRWYRERARIMTSLENDLSIADMIKMRRTYSAELTQNGRKGACLEFQELDDSWGMLSNEEKKIPIEDRVKAYESTQLSIP